MTTKTTSPTIDKIEASSATFSSTRIDTFPTPSRRTRITTQTPRCEVTRWRWITSKRISKWLKSKNTTVRYGVVYVVVVACHFLFLTKDVYAFSSSSLFDFASCARVNGWFWLCSTRVFLFAAAPRAHYYVREEEEEEEDLVLLLLLLLLRRYARRAPTTGRENRAVSEGVAEIEERFDARKIQRKEGRGREEGDEC